ncbi:zinc finger CCCH domain-containing protein 9 [Elaeis guineensis]|uniref:Zinc finger CCCH domain-containing protein 9 n=1 Tax=Elaeis guineensis var. tenera TaxID=51953 RepID=A0A6I9RD49_ELAGV|nr:zinc finger CCCH domain-containing protein 9 [Elaeis guineensis]
MSPLGSETVANRMQQKLLTPTNSDRLRSAIGTAPFLSPDRRFSCPPYFANDGDSFWPYASVISTTEETTTRVTQPTGSGSVSLNPSTVSFDEEDPTGTENRLYLARLTLQYREIAEHYDLCLSHLQEAAQEAEALRLENAKLRIANSELAKRLNLLSGKQNWQIASPAAGGHPILSIVDEFGRLSVGEPPAETSPTSVLAFRENQFARRATEKRGLPLKSISVRSNGYLKLNQGVSAANRNDRLRVSSPVMVDSQKVCVGGASKKKGERRGREEDEERGEALDLEVYNQGMFKTELCNKWEESGECPYGENCQFAHGITELRPVIRHPRYKTQICRMILAGDTCPYGHRCHFRHTSPSDCFLLRPS